MILYLDTSALVKKYFKESFSEMLVAAWNQADEVATSAVAYAEALAAIYRKKRASGPEALALFDKAMVDFKNDWTGFIRVEVNDGLNDLIRSVLEKHPLRGFDAIHLASALLIHERLPNDLIFACFDERLTQSAMGEGLPLLRASM
ncbi:MAG: type II toxin-antitoxin system VapC family toxin [Pseudomonadota bacterium]